MKNILVTGGASGLGEAIVKQAAGKYNVNFTYSLSKSNAEKLAENKNVKAIHCDFTYPKSIDQLVAQLPTLNLDGIIFNAMTGFERKHFHKISADDFNKSFQENVISTIKLAQAAIKFFRKKKSGKIITVLSAAIQTHPAIGWSEYLAQKSYLKSLAKSWAAENSKHGIQSNMVSPGFMLTSIHGDIDEREIEQIRSVNPTGEILKVEQVAKTVQFLLESDTSINGVDMLINSGEKI